MSSTKIQKKNLRNIARNIEQEQQSPAFILLPLFGERDFDGLNTKWVCYLSSIHGSITEELFTPKFHSIDWIQRDFNILHHIKIMNGIKLLIFTYWCKILKPFRSFSSSIYRNNESKSALCKWNYSIEANGVLQKSWKLKKTLLWNWCCVNNTL